jgi:hypothetical protein
MTTNSNLDFTYTSLAPLSERQQEALETGLNPNQFAFVPEEVVPDPDPTLRKKSGKRKSKGSDDNPG